MKRPVSPIRLKVGRSRALWRPFEQSIDRGYTRFASQDAECRVPCFEYF